MNPATIDALLAKRDKILSRRDGLIDSKRIASIDAKLSTVPAGQDNRVDLALGRSCSVLPPRPMYLHQCGWCGEYYTGSRVDHGCPPLPVTAAEEDYIDSFEVKPGWFQNPAVTLELSAAEIAEMQARCAETMTEAPDYPGMWM